MNLQSQSLPASQQSLRYHYRFLKTPVSDWIQNQRFLDHSSHFLFLRHAAREPRIYKRLFHWVAQELPQVRSKFKLCSLPCHVSDWSRVKLLVPWLSDALLHELPDVYLRAKQLEKNCEDHSIAVINPVDSVINTSKSKAPELIRSAGVSCPRAISITDVRQFRRDLGGLEFPLIIREDHIHGGRTPMYQVDSLSDLQQVPFQEFTSPIAVEFFDTQSPEDGLCRRYRYFAAGELGVALNMLVSKHWEVRGTTAIRNHPQLEREEFEFAQQPDPNHDQLQAARRALGLDAVAFDYSYDQNGDLVVWEANALPGLNPPAAISKARDRFLMQMFVKTTAMSLHLYHLRSGLELPERVAQILEFSTDSWLEQRAA